MLVFAPTGQRTAQCFATTWLLVCSATSQGHTQVDTALSHSPTPQWRLCSPHRLQWWHRQAVWYQLVQKSPWNNRIPGKRKESWTQSRFHIWEHVPHPLPNSLRSHQGVSKQHSTLQNSMLPVKVHSLGARPQCLTRVHVGEVKATISTLHLSIFARWQNSDLKSQKDALGLRVLSTPVASAS